MKRSCSQPGLLLGLLTLMVFAAPPALACDDDDEVRVTVVAIYASEKSDKIDPRLKDVAKAIQKKYPELKGFRFGKQNREAVEVGKEMKFDLGDGLSTAVTVRHGADKNNQVGLTVQACCFGRCCYTTCCGKYLPLKTCHKNDKDECLIVAIMVRPCQVK